MDDDDFGDFAASPAPEEPASFAAFDAFPPDTAPSAAVTEAFPTPTQENEAAWDQTAARTISYAEREDDDFGDFGEVPAPLSTPVLPPAPAPVPASPAPPADDDFGDFDEATPATEKTPQPPVCAPSPVVERVSLDAFGDDLVAERSPKAFLEAVDAVLARAFPEAGTSGSARTDGDGDGDGDGAADADRARVELSRLARDAAGGSGVFAAALVSCVAGWAPAVAAGVAPPDAARRAALAPKAWDASPARAALAAAVRGAPPPPPPPVPPVPPADPGPSALGPSTSPPAPAPAPPAVAKETASDAPEASFARFDGGDKQVAAELPEGPGVGEAFGDFGEAAPPRAEVPPPEPIDAFGDSAASAASSETREARPSEHEREGALDLPSLAFEEEAGPGAAETESFFPVAVPETGSDPEDAFGSFEAAPPSPPPLRPSAMPSEPPAGEAGEDADAFGDFEGPSADPPGFGAFEEAARAPEPGAPEPPEPPEPSEPSEPALVDPAPTRTSPEPAPPVPAATPTVSGGADDFAALFRPVTDAGAPRDFFDSRREDVSEAPAAFVAPLVPTNPPSDDFADLFGPVQDTKPLELGAFEASPAPEATPPVAEDAEDDFGDFEASPMPSVVGDGGGDGLGGFGDFAAPPPAVPPAVPAVDALAELFGDARVAGSPPPAADEDEFGAFQ